MPEVQPFIREPTRGRATAKHTRAEFLSRQGTTNRDRNLWNSPNSPRSSAKWIDSPVKGLVSLPSTKTKNQQEFYSTFHKTPDRKKFSKQEWEDCTEESTRQALADWASSPEFTDWLVKNADRVKVLPDESSDESLGSGSDSTDEAAVETSNNGFGFYKWQQQLLSQSSLVKLWLKLQVNQVYIRMKALKVFKGGNITGISPLVPNLCSPGLLKLKAEPTVVSLHGLDGAQHNQRPYFKLVSSVPHNY
ncbi:hypothetical protein POM88_012812 [Heracleum sosnowskyi]|uniref:Uncharacterized protein n=1 Tax=Heracleum sosnowskyi TaxID=360622 RepID=A0AAD8IY36_9APIA|nr:hypothetical protein POM88_012812 [Heracleum sosnowskyi]